MIYNPTSIIKCLSVQAIYINKVYGQMFYYTDLSQIWVDTQNGGRVYADDIQILQFEYERNNYIPNKINNLLTYVYVYVVETNCLYTYQFVSRIWSRIYGVYGVTNVAQTYTPSGEYVSINADDVTTNGILNDGSVVVRDNNKMICGIFNSNGYTLNLRSLIGGQLNLDPSGIINGSGCLQLNAENLTANLNSDLTVFGNIKIADKSDWYKQYRLITEDIVISTNSLIKKGSLVKAGSKLEIETTSTIYSVDTVLTEDISTNSGELKLGCKIYINSVINNSLISPPYLFDTNSITTSNIPLVIELPDDKWKINETNIEIDENYNIFGNTGDCLIVNTTDKDLTKIKAIMFTDDNQTTINVDYVSDSGINNIAKLYYYKTANIIKIIP